MVDFEVFFYLSDGKVLLQTARYAHLYDDPLEAAKDVRKLLDGESPTGWYGNQPEIRIKYDPKAESKREYEWRPRWKVISVLNYWINRDLDSLKKVPEKIIFPRRHFYEALVRLSRSSSKK